MIKKIAQKVISIGKRSPRQGSLSGILGRQRSEFSAGNVHSFERDALETFALARAESRDSIDRLFGAWAETLNLAFSAIENTGGSRVRAIAEILPSINMLERLTERTRGIQTQYTLQGAVAVVLPWVVMGMSLGIGQNFFTAFGAFLQLFALSWFVILVRRTLAIADLGHDKNIEMAVCLRIALLGWVLSSSGLAVAQMIPQFRKAAAQLTIDRGGWNYFFEDGLESGVCAKNQSGPSADLQLAIRGFFLRGGAVSLGFRDSFQVLIESRERAFENALQALPTKVSLVFSGVLLPAVLLIFMGSLCEKMSWAL